MFKISKIGFVITTMFILNACAGGGIFYASQEHLEKSCTALNREHTLLGRKVRGLMVKTLRARKSYATARRVSKSYSNWPVYFIVEGNDDFNEKMTAFKTQYQKIRYASTQKKCTYFRDVLATDAYRAADSKY